MRTLTLTVTLTVTLTLTLILAPTPTLTLSLSLTRTLTLILALALTLTRSDEDAARALRACATALATAPAGEPRGRIVVADLALPAGQAANGSGHINLRVDALLALMGNRGERTTTRWQSVAAAAGLEVESFVETPSPSIGLVVLRSCQ